MLRFCFVMILTAAFAPAQTREPGDAWLMQNFRFAPAPQPGEVPPVSPTVARLQEVLQTTLSILHKANHDGDYEAALAAAAQATATIQMLGAVSGDVKPPQRQSPASLPVPVKIWVDRWMLHYLTADGAHVQIRLDQIERKPAGKLSNDFSPMLSLLSASALLL